MIKFEDYDYREHLHRYGVWTAARAQRAFMTTAHIKKALDEIDLKGQVFKLPFDMSTIAFDQWHAGICNRLKDILKKQKNQEVEFGRAAKIISIYLKTTIVIPNCKNNSSLLNVIHPPIDAILLRCLISEELLLKEMRFVRWTTMKQTDYMLIITSIRQHLTSKGLPLWTAEACWKPENEKTLPDVSSSGEN